MHRAVAATIGVILSLAPNSRAEDGARDDTVRVEISKTTDKGVALVLERVIEGTSLWESVCVGTCDARVPREGQYRVNGSNIRPSRPLELSPTHDTVHLETDVAYKTGWIGGVVLTTVGPAVAIGGALAIAFNQPNNFTPPCNVTPCPAAPPVSNAPVVAGAVTLGVGLAMTVAGIIALVTTDHSKVRQLGIVALATRSVTVTF